MKNTENNNLYNNYLIKAAAFATCFFLSQPIFADAIDQMKTVADNILEYFTHPLVKVILAIFLCGSAIAYAFNKDNEKIKRNSIAIGIAAVILMLATGIVGLVWDAF